MNKDRVFFSVLAPLTAVAGFGLALEQHSSATRFALLTPEQERILSHMSLVELDDGQGGRLRAVALLRRRRPLELDSRLRPAA